MLAIFAFLPYFIKLVILPVGVDNHTAGETRRQIHNIEFHEGDNLTAVAQGYVCCINLFSMECVIIVACILGFFRDTIYLQAVKARV